RDIDAILAAVADGSLSALVVGAVDPADTADPATAARALERAGFVVSLEIRHSAVTEHADVVLPVAPPVEKAGRYVDWEGRRRPFEPTLQSGAISDAQVLDALAEELDVRLGLRTVTAARDELARLGSWDERLPAPSRAAGPVATPGSGQAVLATWHEVLDAGRSQDGDEHLAGTAKPARAVLSASTAARLGIADGGTVAVSSDAGVIVVPAVIGEAADGVVWLPTNARDCAVRATLGVTAGAVVGVTSSSAPPVIGADPSAAAGGDA
ncbi:MAG TPA: molybdopterin dinucleotide binding domain-containing protein, partial [Jatrophihabitantaceae bacterium]|nr:molybdopterin dinucleotide binding domain-containing protein [Jatrophihabitantaceae bacterium]